MVSFESSGGALLALALLVACSGSQDEAPGGGGASGDAGARLSDGAAADVDGAATPTCQPPAPGCPCHQGQVAACYVGPAGTRGVGECRPGAMTCAGAHFGACVGGQVPEPERCDGLDNSCDGATDEGLSDCVPCAPPGCEIHAFGPGQGGSFSDGESLGGDVRVTPEGSLTLQAEERILNDVWIANTNEGTVSRLDATSGRELARYASVLPVAGLRPFDEPCDKLGGHGNCPSRTAVSMEGDVFVANRAFAGQGSVTKILGAACPDRNGDGNVRTSHDADGDGRIALDDPAEFFGSLDECLAFTVPVGPSGGVLRALAVDPFQPPGAGSVWAGAYEEQAIYRVHGVTGEVLSRVPLPLHPYGALMAQDGTLWVTSLAGVDDAIVSVDGVSEEVSELIPVRNSQSCTDHRSKGGYGITIDRVGRVWLGGWVCEAALRYDPANQEWFSVQLPGLGYTRGVAADAAGYVWAAQSHQAVSPFEMLGRVTRFSAEDGGDRKTYELPGQRETIGVGVDSAGAIWAVSKDTDTATRIDPSTDQMTHHPVGDGPYTYSDFTGYSLRTFIAPAGLWFGTARACPAEVRPQWRRLSWEAQRPEGTRLQIYLRAADHPSALDQAYRFGPYESSPIDLQDAQLPRSSHLRVEVEMEARGRDAAPVLRWLRLEVECPVEG